MIQPVVFYRALSFYIGVPLVIGLAFGFSQSGMLAPLLRKPVSIIYWITLLLVLWALYEICSRLAARALKRYRPPLWLILVVGSLIQTPLGAIYIGLHQRFFAAFLPEPNAFAHLSFGSLQTMLLEYPRMLLQNAVPMAIWLGVNYFFDRLVGMPRFRHAAPELSTPPRAPEPSPPVNEPSVVPQPRLVSRLPDAVQGEIRSISALDHYLQVTTDNGSAVVHGRLAEAIADMPKDCGWQVHRSHWVHRAAIKRLLVDQQKYRLERSDGVIVPVSNRYVELLKAAGFKPQPMPRKT